MQHINTLIPRTQYHKAVFMARYPVYGWVFMSSLSSSLASSLLLIFTGVTHCKLSMTRWSLSLQTDSLSLSLPLPDVPMSPCPHVSASPSTSDSWPRSPLSQSENNGNDISSFLSGSNCNDQLLVACAPYAPPCPQNCRVFEWKMQCMRTENTRLIS